MAFFFSYGPVYGALLWVGLIAASWSDLRLRKVPNGLNAAIALCGLAYQLHHFGGAGLLTGLGGMGVGFALIIVPFALRLYRGGDAKLVIALGAWLGAGTTAWMFLWGVALGGLVAVGVLLFAGDAARSQIRQNLERAARTVSLPTVEADRPARLHVPMALAFSVGAVVALSWR